ncbi:MAG TPA: hypothetical protein VF077_07350 [Nitrospiraceae bacterium]
MTEKMTLKAARAATGDIGFPSKMPGTSYGIPAQACITGGKLAQIPGSVCYGCYALKGNYLYPSVQIAQSRRLAAINDPLWVKGMVNIINHAQRTGKGRNGPIAKGYHRWHDSGDTQSEKHIGKICEVARLTPKVKHWLPTRELAMLLRFIANGGVVPPNLTIRVSATMIDGPATTKWEHTSGVHYAAMPPKDQICPAPTQDGRCGPCRKCWDKSVPHVSYHKH